MTTRSTVKATLFGLLALSSLALTACDHDRPRHHDANAFTWAGQLAAPATVQVRNTRGSITVEPYADDQLHVVAATSWTRGDPKKDVQFRVVTVGTTVTVCAVWDNGECSATEYSSKKRNGFSIRRSSRSDVAVALKLQVPAGVRVDAWTVQGDVSVRAAAPVHARTIDGDIKVGTAVGPVDAETINGDVDVRMTTVGDTGAIRAVTTNGDASAWVPEIVDGHLEAATLNGEVGSDFGATAGDEVRVRGKFETSIGAGAREYKVQSLNGSAWLRLINADGTVGLKQKASTAASAAPTTPSAPAAPKRAAKAPGRTAKH